MEEIEKELKDYGLNIRYNDSKDAEPIDFSIEDGEDNVAWVWGTDSKDVDWECNHPIVDYDDDETVGECVLCGSYCDWHEEVSADDGHTIKERIPHNWYPRQSVGGIIEKIIERSSK